MANKQEKEAAINPHQEFLSRNKKKKFITEWQLSEQNKLVKFCTVLFLLARLLDDVLVVFVWSNLKNYHILAWKVLRRFWRNLNDKQF